MSTISKHSVDLNQGQDEQGRTFGYVAGDEGGYFFTWMPTLQETLASVEVDEVDGDGELDEAEVVDFLRDYLPTTKRGSKWAATDTVYVVCDASGEYLRADGRRTPASNEAVEFESRKDAEAACDRATDRVIETEPA